jgi:hypothetical protein
MRVRIIVQPTGCINGKYWPEVGETIDLPDAAAADMIAAGHVEAVPEKKAAPKVEKRPAPKSGTETRAKKG